MNVQDKALTAVAALSDLVKAMRIDGDQVAVDRHDYEQMLANQADTYAEQVAHAMQTAFDDSPVALSYKERQEMVLDHAGKPARVFMQWDYDKSPDWNDHNLFQGVRIELKRVNFMRLMIPSCYTREEALQGLRELVQFVELGYDDASGQAQQLAKRELPSSFEADEIAF